DQAMGGPAGVARVDLDPGALDVRHVVEASITGHPQARDRERVIRDYPLEECRGLGDLAGVDHGDGALVVLEPVALGRDDGRARGSENQGHGHEAQTTKEAVDLLPHRCSLLPKTAPEGATISRHV